MTIEDDDLWKTFTKSVKAYTSSGQKIEPLDSPFVFSEKQKKDGSIEIVQKKRPIQVVLQKRKLSPPDFSKSGQKTYRFEKQYFKKIVYQSTLDLHDHTISEAEIKLCQFFLKAQHTQKKYVLVITGKGNPEKGTGVLRLAVLAWFENHPEFIVGYSEAYPHDGGSGAFYVHVRKRHI